MPRLTFTCSTAIELYAHVRSEPPWTRMASPSDIIGFEVGLTTLLLKGEETSAPGNCMVGVKVWLL